MHAIAPRHSHQFLKNFNYTFKNLQKPFAAHKFCWQLPTWHCDSVVCAEASMTSLIALPHDSWVMRITDSVGITFNCHLKCLWKDYIVTWHNIRLLLMEKVCRVGFSVIQITRGMALFLPCFLSFLPILPLSSAFPSLFFPVSHSPALWQCLST